MFLNRWLAEMVQKINLEAGSERRQRRFRRREHFRPSLELLETRLAPAVSLSVADPVPFPEGSSGTTNMMFVVTRSGDLAPPLMVDFTTRDGTARAGVDYTATSGTLTFAASQTTAMISVPIIGNTLIQQDRTFTVELANPLFSAAFATQQTFATGTQPRSGAAGDFNGDGKPDLVVANRASPTVSVLLNTTTPGAATATFATQVTFATGTGPYSVTVGDFNGDGKPDLAIANSGSANVSVLLNTTAPGATTPIFASQVTFATGTNPVSVAVGDLNGDGKPDLAVANAASTTVSVLLNMTAAGATMPSFAAQQTFPTGSFPFGVAVGDLNGDGKPDLAVANGSSATVSVLLNMTAAGATTPIFASQVTFATGTSPISVAVTDLNGDSKPDLAVANNVAAGTVSVLLNMTAAGATTPTFAPQQTFVTGNAPIAVAAGDLNGDGKPDLAVANAGAATVSVLLNTTTTGATTPSFAPQQSFDTGTSPRSVAVEDFNGDGKLDLAAANQGSNTVSVLLNQSGPAIAPPSFAAQQTFATGTRPRSVAVGDVNGDSKPDLAVANRLSNTVSVLLNTTTPGAATPSFAPQQTFDTGTNSVSVVLGDFDGDGKPDLAVANSISETVSVLLNTTAPGAAIPSFAPQQTFATGSSPISLAVGDFNGDGRPDLAAANYVSSGTVSVLLNTTASEAVALSFAPQQPFGTGSKPFLVAAGDFNGDGKPDLAVANLNSDTVSVLRNITPAGAATPSFSLQQTFATGSSPISLAVGDFNGDGKPDLAVANRNSDTLSVLLNMTAAGAAFPSFAAQVAFATGSNPFSVAVGDFNGDGKPDLAAADYGSNNVSVLLNTTAPGAAALSFAPQQTFATGSFPRSVAVGDFNGDGRPDLAAANDISAGTVSVLLNTTPPATAAPSFGALGNFATGSHPRSVATGDLNGDGRPDLAVTNRDANTVSVLLNATAPGATAPNFAAQQTFATGNVPMAVAVGDLNGDGRLDLAVANFNSSTVSVLLNTTAPGASTLSFAPQQTFATGNFPSSVAVGDFNGDGKPDLAVASLNTGTISVLRNTTAPGAATPSFAPQQPFTIGLLPDSLAVGDFNGDGKPDLAAVGRDSDRVSVLLNRTPPGLAGFSFAPQQSFAVWASPLSVAVADFNGDGKLDLVTANLIAGTVSVLVNTTPPGDTSPQFATQVALAAGNRPYAVAVGDLNGDGKPDLAVTNGNPSTVSVLLNMTVPGTTIPSFALRAAFATGSTPYAVAVADVNGDGKPDLAVANYGSNTVSVLLNTTVLAADAPGFRGQQSFATGNGPFAVAVGDFNGDGKPDLAAANFNSITGGNTVSVLLNTTAPGAITPSFTAQQAFAAGNQPEAVAVGDFNGDGKPDLAIANGGFATTVSVLLNMTAPGATSPSFTARQPFVTGSDSNSVVVGDFNGDGKPDLAVASRTSGTVSVLLNTTAPGAATSSFAPQQAFATGGTSSFTNVLAVGDFNSDGRPDLAVANRDANTVSVLLNTTTPGAATPSFAVRQPFATGSNPVSVAVGDLNGDGRPDLAVPNGGTVSVLLNTTAAGATSPSFAMQQTFATGSDPLSVAVEDFNGDGKPDLVIANNDSDTVSVLLNMTGPAIGLPSFAPQQTFATGSSPGSVAVAEFNGDGKPDLAVANYISDSVSVLLNQAAAFIPLGSPATGTIRDDDGPAQGLLQFSATGYSINENGGQATITVTRTVGSSGTVTVVFATSNGTATAGADYTATTGTLTFLPGQTSQTFAVPVLSDADVEPTETVNLSLSSPTGGAALGFPSTAVLSITDDPPVTLRVASFTSTNTGFVATFNRAIDRGVLNLYATETGGQGPADVVLTGTSTGLVRGSLVVDPASTRVTFLRTGGVLAADTYTVTLRSAANAFRTPTGEMLDGNADGTAGDNYVNTFTVASSSAVVVSVPDFTRGPDQPVNIPANTSNGIPLRLSNATGVDSVDLTLRYDPALLTITGAVRGPLTPTDAQVIINTTTPGVAILSFSSATPLSSNANDFVLLTASVPLTATSRYTDKHVLDLSNLLVNDAAARDDDGIHINAYLGDTNANGGFSSLDAQRVARVVVGLDGGFQSFPLGDPVVVADITGNGLLTSADATRILQKVVGLEPGASLIPIPAGITIPQPPGPDPLLHFPKHFSARRGGTIAAPLLLDPYDGLESADLAISYDTQRLELIVVLRGDLTTDFDLFLVNHDAEAGTIRVGMARSAGPIQGPGSGRVLKITFRIKANAPAGKAIINLRQNVSTTATSLNEGGLDLIPDPSNEAGDRLDGAITILPNRAVKPVPSPTATDVVFAELARKSAKRRAF